MWRWSLDWSTQIYPGIVFSCLWHYFKKKQTCTSTDQVEQRWRPSIWRQGWLPSWLNSARSGPLGVRPASTSQPPEASSTWPSPAPSVTLVLPSLLPPLLLHHWRATMVPLTPLTLLLASAAGLVTEGQLNMSEEDREQPWTRSSSPLPSLNQYLHHH